MIVIGYGWCGALVADRLAGAGHDVLVIERGEDTPTDPAGRPLARAEADGRRWRWQRTSQDSFTLRHDLRSPAYPLRRLEVFGSGEGVGGSGLLWGGTSERFPPAAFRPATEYGERIDPAEADLADWPLDYAELEPHYREFEEILGLAGEPDPHPDAGARSGPLAHHGPDDDHRRAMVRAAAAASGQHPHTVPAALLHEEHVNSLGVLRVPDPDTGVSLATPLNTIRPHTEQTGRVRIVSGATVRRIVHDRTAAAGVVYATVEGEREARADAVVLAAWTLQNTRLLLLSRIGAPYDPETGTGQVGRGYAGHLSVTSVGFFDRVLPSSRTHASIGFTDADADELHGSVGSAFHMSTSFGPLDPRDSLLLPAESPDWGADWKRDLVAWHGRKLTDTAIAEALPSPRRFLDLDPRYRDARGDPLLRITFDWQENERRLVERHGAVSRAVLWEAGATTAETIAPAFPYDTTRYQNTHLAGGARMGSDPDHSAVDRWLRSWQLPNLWVVGASAFPSASAPPPTLTAGALALRAADDILRTLSNGARR